MDIQTPQTAVLKHPIFNSAVAGATRGYSVSVIVGVTHVRATRIVMEKDLILQIETVLAHAN